jgi:hypothetical protein
MLLLAPPLTLGPLTLAPSAPEADLDLAHTRICDPVQSHVAGSELQREPGAEGLRDEGGRLASVPPVPVQRLLAPSARLQCAPTADWVHDQENSWPGRRAHGATQRAFLSPAIAPMETSVSDIEARGMMPTYEVGHLQACISLEQDDTDPGQAQHARSCF